MPIEAKSFHRILRLGKTRLDTSTAERGEARSAQ